MPSVPSSPGFPLLDAYLGARLGLDLASLAAGRVAVVASPRRLRREESYGFIHALWWIWLEDGRSAVSVVPGAEAAVEGIVVGVGAVEQLFDPALAARLRLAVDAALARHALPATDRVIHSLCFACNAALLRHHTRADCRRLTDASVPPAEGIQFPAHWLPGGIAYGVVEDGLVVSVAYAHRTGLMEDMVADVGVETAPAYRRRGYAQTAVSAVVAEIAGRGGEALYDPSPDNVPSIATARSVGFVPYARALALATPSRLEGEAPAEPHPRHGEHSVSLEGEAPAEPYLAMASAPPPWRARLLPSRTLAMASASPPWRARLPPSRSLAMANASPGGGARAVARGLRTLAANGSAGASPSTGWGACCA